MTNPRWETDEVIAWLRAEMAALMATSLDVPLDLHDGRPWVRTHEEEHPASLWSNGHGCGHFTCEAPR